MREELACLRAVYIREMAAIILDVQCHFHLIECVHSYTYLLLLLILNSKFI